MDKDAFNQKQIDTGAFQGRHLTRLTELWQDLHFLDPLDGKCGEQTLKSIMCEELVIPEAPTKPSISPIALRALRIAEVEIGHGEDPSLGNNRGADVDRFRRGDGTGKGPGGSSSWCAVFVSYCYVQSSDDLPFKTSRGAKKLGDNIALAGRDCDLPEIGAIIVWDRGLVRWKGHIGFCFKYDPVTDTLITIEGNKTRKGQRFAKVDFFTYPNGEWRKKLHRISMLTEPTK